MQFLIPDSSADINPGSIPFATPPVVRGLSQEGEAFHISEVAFTSGEEAAAQGPRCEEESAGPPCSSQTGSP